MRSAAPSSTRRLQSSRALPSDSSDAVIVTFAGSAAAFAAQCVLILCSPCEVNYEGEPEFIRCSRIPRRKWRQPRGFPHASMFLRMLVRAAVLRGTGRFRIVCHGCGRCRRYHHAESLHRRAGQTAARVPQLRREHNSGSQERRFLPADALSHVESVMAGRGLVAPFCAGGGADQRRPADCCGRHGFRSGSPARSLVVGEQLAFGSATGADRRTSSSRGLAEKAAFRSQLSGTHHSPHSAGTVHTGAAEDSRVYLSLADFVSWTGVQASTIEIAATGSPEEITGIMRQLEQAIPAADARPVRQIMEGEARVLARLGPRCWPPGAYYSDGCAMRALHFDGMVFDRRRDFAIMKALGASDRLLNGFFAAEAAALARPAR